MPKFNHRFRVLKSSGLQAASILLLIFNLNLFLLKGMSLHLSNISPRKYCSLYQKSKGTLYYSKIL